MTLKAPTAAFIKVRDARAATPAEADNMMKAARSMYHWACDAGHTSVNPLVGIKKIHRSKGGATPWTTDDLRKFKKRQEGPVFLCLYDHQRFPARSCSRRTA